MARQWVLTLPGELARVVAFDTGLATAVFGVFAEELARWLRNRAHEVGLAAPETGCLVELQRFADGARLYPHAHALVPDGVFVASFDEQRVRFIRQDPPRDEDVAHVVSRVEQPVTRLLGRWRASVSLDSDDDDILPACAEVPPTELVRLLGHNQGHERRPAPNRPLCVRSPGGLELHAEVTLRRRPGEARLPAKFASHDRKGLERLCRYLSRPAIPQDGAGCGGAGAPCLRAPAAGEVAVAHRR